jgi:hypothetical protein
MKPEELYGVAVSHFDIYLYRVLGLIHTLCITFPFRSLFRLCSIRMVCVHTVRRVQSPSRTVSNRRPVIIAIKYASPFVF